MRHKCMKWFSTFSQHKKKFQQYFHFYIIFAHNHADMIMCIDNDYLLIFSMLFFESANVIDAVCIFEKISQKYALYELNFVPLYSKTVMKNN